jgi:hypothetical protein
VLPGLLITLLTIWPWLDRTSAAVAGVWLAKERRTQNLAFVAVVAVVVIFTIIGLVLRGPYWQFYWPWERWPDIPTRI